MNKWLIQFDIRVDPQQYAERRWDAARRSTYLLRPEVRWPLTVDAMAWPSVFHLQGTRPADSPIELSWDGLADKPWLNLEGLKTRYATHRALAPAAISIGIELLSEIEADGDDLMYLQDGMQCGLLLEPTNPGRLPEDSTLLGYDVADGGRISGLVNCGYTQEDLLALRPTWDLRLNAFGLFDSIEDAVAYRDITDARVPEHAPFWVYALWQLRR